MGNEQSTNVGSINCSQMLCHLLDQTHDNGAAILNLVERYVNHFALQYCNLSFHERQDIQQEVAIKLICHGPKVRNNCTKSWVYMVVRNQCINHVRKEAGQSTILKSSDDPEGRAHVVGLPPSAREGVDIALLQQMDCLHKVFGRIESNKTGHADIALYTKYALGLSYSEISKCSKRTISAVTQRISVLKSRLKKLIDEYC